MKTVYKPWGKEEWLELNDRYCYKRIYINAGYKTSFQYHNFKRETNYIISGEAEVWLENDNGIVEKKLMKAGDFFNVTPPKKHRVIALSDIILQEVSTPEVDDVIRLDDDSNRKDGKIDGEHQVPAVLILSAGLGTRLQKLTKHVNKSLVPLGEKAVISHIIEKFPTEYDVVIAVGHLSESLKEYCDLAHSDRKITYVDVDKFEGEGTGPGYSALQCKSLLQRPFYIVTADCLISVDLPQLDGNWLGVYPTAYPEKYSTVESTKSGDVLSLVNKKSDGFDMAFIGLAAIRDYQVFWDCLSSAIQNGELVSAWYNASKYPQLKIKVLEWFDLGNLDDFNKTQMILGVPPLSLSKDVGEFTYHVNDKFLKFNCNESVTTNRVERGLHLGGKIPHRFKSTKHFISYDWVNGKTLYKHDNLELYKQFMDTFVEEPKEPIVLSAQNMSDFYGVKTSDRISAFISKYGEKYYTESLLINGDIFPSLKSIMEKPFDFKGNIGYKAFHGDLQFDNIVYDEITTKFYYLDWRESFAGNTDHGDLYYDIAKLYGGLLISYDKMKDNKNLKFTESFPQINYSITTTKNLIELNQLFDLWAEKHGVYLKTIKTMTGLIFINMAPLHDESFGKTLWCKGIEMLHANK